MLFQGPTTWVDVVTIASLTVGLVAVLARLWRKRIRPWWVRRSASRRALEITLMGRDEIADPVTKEIISEAVPPIGIRLGGIERVLEKVSEALAANVKTQELVLALKLRVDHHDTEIDLIKRGQTERIVTKLENAAAMQMIDNLQGGEQARQSQGDDEPDEPDELVSKPEDE